MARELRELTVLAEEPSSVPRACKLVAYNCLNCSSWGSDASDLLGRKHTLTRALTHFKKINTNLWKRIRLLAHSPHIQGGGTEAVHTSGWMRIEPRGTGSAHEDRQG